MTWPSPAVGIHCLDLPNQMHPGFGRNWLGYYTPLLLTISFFGGLTTLGLGIVGQYLLLSLRNARQRPNFVIKSRLEFGPAASGNLNSNE